MPETISSNGHKQVDTEVLERLVDDIQSEASEEAPKPTRRRRSKAEVTAERNSAEVSLSIDGTSYEGSPQAIASVLKAMAA